MNLSQKCNCCLHNGVCKDAERYKAAVENILDCNVSNENGHYHRLRDAKFIEVSIKCPNILTQSTIKGA